MLVIVGTCVLTLRFGRKVGTLLRHGLALDVGVMGVGAFYTADSVRVEIAIPTNYSVDSLVIFFSNCQFAIYRLHMMPTRFAARRPVTFQLIRQNVPPPFDYIKR